MTPSNDYLRLPLWPPVPITEIRQPVPVSVCAHTQVCLFPFPWSKMHVWFWLAHMHVYSVLAIRGQTLPFPHCLAPVCTEGWAGALASMTRQPLLIASRTADGLRRKTYLSWENVERTADWFWEVGNKSNILPVLSWISKLPSSIFALLSAPSLLAFSFSCLATIAFFLSDSFIPLFLIPPHICLPHSLGKGLGGWGGGWGLWLELYFPACCGRRRVWPHGIAISPARQYGFRQLQAAAGSLIRAFVMSLHLTCRRCHVVLEGGRPIIDWGCAGKAVTHRFNTKVPSSRQLLRLDWKW